MVGTITDTHGIIAIAAAAVALAALIGCAILARNVARLRRAQTMLLGDHAPSDLVAHAAVLSDSFAALNERVESAAAHVDGRISTVESALSRTIAHRALVRYDAYNELSGHQSLSLALLDDERSGVVLSCIHHRDQARVYIKQVIAGRGELELSPEEAQAVQAALSADGRSDVPEPDERASG